MRVGGPARWFLASDDSQALARLLDAAQQAGVKRLVLGGGTNLLVADAGFDGVVVKYTGDGFEVEDGPEGAPVVRTLAGTNLSNLARRLARDGGPSLGDARRGGRRPR